MNEKGFSMVETMFGISLFTTALFPIMLMLAYSLTFGTAAGNRAIAMNEARRVVEDIRRIADTNGLDAVVSTTWSGSTLPGESISVTDLYDVDLGVSAYADLDPLPVRVTVAWTEKGKTSYYRVETMVTDR